MIAAPRIGSVNASTWFGFFAMCLGMFMAILDIQVVVTSLPEIQRALAIEPDQMSWVQTAYLIAEVIAIPLTGLLTRAVTMRGLFAAAIVIFTLASIGCAASDGFSSLVAWRVVQGFAGGMLIPLVFSAVFLLFPFRTQGVATTIAGVLAVLAPTCGPLVGGWITQTFSWPWLFLINVAPGVVSLVVAWIFLLRDPPDFSYLRKLDAPSLIAMALGLAALEIALKEAPTRGWTSGLPIALLTIAIANGALFVARTQQNPRGSVDLSALRDRNFAIGCALSFILGMGLYGSVYLMPVFLAFVREHGPLMIGWIMLTTGAAQMLSAPFAVELERRLDARVLTCLGFAVFAGGLLMSASATFATDQAEMFWPQVVRGVAIMFCLLPPTRLALGHFEPARVSDASGLFNLMRTLGGAIGIALIDTIIFGRSAQIVDSLNAKIMSGDAAAARAIGASTDLVARAMTDETAQAIIRPLIERQGLVESINEAWLMLGLITSVGLLLAPFAKAHPRTDAQGGSGPHEAMQRRDA